MNRKACVVGSAPSGYTADPKSCRKPGGGVRSMQLTVPGFLHDFGSAVYPLGAGSPFFSRLRLREHGLEWVHSPAPLAHPLDDGSAVTLEREFRDNETSLGEDGRIWTNLLRPFVEHWKEFAPEVLGPQPSIPRH